MADEEAREGQGAVPVLGPDPWVRTSAGWGPVVGGVMSVPARCVAPLAKVTSSTRASSTRRATRRGWPSTSQTRVRAGTAPSAGSKRTRAASGSGTAIDRPTVKARVPAGVRARTHPLSSKATSCPGPSSSQTWTSTKPPASQRYAPQS